MDATVALRAPSAASTDSVDREIDRFIRAMPKHGCEINVAAIGLGGRVYVGSLRGSGLRGEQSDVVDPSLIESEILRMARKLGHWPMPQKEAGP